MLNQRPAKTLLVATLLALRIVSVTAACRNPLAPPARVEMKVGNVKIFRAD